MKCCSRTTIRMSHVCHGRALGLMCRATVCSGLNGVPHPLVFTPVNVSRVVPVALPQACLWVASAPILKLRYKSPHVSFHAHRLCAHLPEAPSQRLLVQVSFERGEIVQGTVIQFEPSGALIDIGAKATAYMPAREVRCRPSAYAPFVRSSSTKRHAFP